MPQSITPDRLAILTVSGSQAEELMKHLTGAGFHFTLIDSRSEMLQEPVVCLMIGCLADQLPDLLGIVRADCRPYRKFIPTQNLLPGELASLPAVEAQLGGARLYLLNVERFEQF